MDVLLTWSGSASHDIAEFFRTWILDVLPGIAPWFSAEDIAKGKKWFPELTSQLANSHVSITFITPDNVRSPWVYYEVGFIAAKLEAASVCPYLIGVDGKQIRDTPLGHYQWTEATKDDTWKLVRSINQHLGEKAHDETILKGNFSSHWLRLKRQVDKLVESLGEVYDSVTEVEPSIEEQLSSEARQLLMAAMQGHGDIGYAQWMDGSSLHAGPIEFLEDYSPRKEAIWKGALDELLNFKLAEDRGYQGEVFRLTRAGWETAERISSRDESNET